MRRALVGFVRGDGSLASASQTMLLDRVGFGLRFASIALAGDALPVVALASDHVEPSKPRPSAAPPSIGGRFITTNPDRSCIMAQTPQAI
jgi:hypothetical protein